MRRLGIALTAISTLVLELALARAFEVILLPNVAYVVITCAVFGYGLAGLYVAVRQRPPARAEQSVPRYAIGAAAATVLLLPLLNLLPFDFDAIAAAPVRQLAAFTVLYLALLVPFFLSGLILVTIFTCNSSDIRRLYCWDLVGAGLGCVLVIPLMPAIGPGGILLLVAGLMLGASALFARSGSGRAAGIVGASLLTALPFLLPADRVELRQHTEKRNVKAAQAAGRVEFTRWDPVAKIDVIPVLFDQERRHAGHPVRRWHVAYDGGLMSSYFFRFDGDYAGLRRRIDGGVPGATRENFWQRAALAAHRLKRDTGAHVLVIGSGGGQETKAALMYGASHVDAVELVGTVVELGLTRYADSIGNIFQDPRVDDYIAEGRSFLRATDARYDVIQLFSSFSPNALARGYGALQPVYLQTTDAYREYFTHLMPDGVLQINFAVYPRMVATAALAWRQLGRTDFRRHVAVFESIRPALPTLLIKMEPWQPSELADLEKFLNADSLDGGMRLVVNPVGADRDFLSDAFFSGDLPRALTARLPYHAEPTTDDRPFYLQLRKRIAPMAVDSHRFVNASIAQLLNGQLKRGWIPLDLLHLLVTGAVSLLFMLATIAVPARYASIGRRPWIGRVPTLVYFGCLGAGFIMLELVLIQLFMKLIGYPLYTYSAVIFVLLLAAGLGSLTSELLGIRPERRWWWPFAGVLVCGTLLLLVHPMVVHAFLAAPLVFRLLAAGVLIFPLGFFLGMPFPLGILVAGRLPDGAVAWAWALNGVCTVAGGLLTAVIAVWLGFRATIVMGLAIYALAFAVFALLRRSGVGSPRQPLELAVSRERRKQPRLLMAP
jgi:spermidine synthase